MSGTNAIIVNGVSQADTRDAQWASTLVEIAVTLIHRRSTS
jgi:hypothetical protein